MDEPKINHESGILRKWQNILRGHPEIAALGTPLVCATVYYPIALLKLKMLEYSFEDFDEVELSILRFCAAGINTPEGLCRWMGLPSKRYVDERLALLTAEGLLQNGKLTELGAESLKIEQKKRLYDAEQIFQADGILGLLLPRAYQRRSDQLISRHETKGKYPHLMHSDEIAEETIRNVIQGEEKLRAYKDYRKSILNVNVEQVQSIRFHSLKYMQVLLVRFPESKSPLVFLPHYRDGVLSDEPLYIPGSLAARLPAMAKDRPVIPDSSLGNLIRLCAMLMANCVTLENACQKNGRSLSGEIKKWVEQNTVFSVADHGWKDGRLRLRLDWGRKDATMQPLDLELMAAAGEKTLCPVELSTSVYPAEGNEQKLLITAWPSAGKLPPEATEMAEKWPSRCREWLRKKTYTYEELQELLKKERETKTDDGE